MTEHTHPHKGNSGIIGVFIGLTVLFFGLLMVLFVLKIVLGIFFFIAPVVGIVTAAYGGFRYFKADSEGEKLSAMSLVAAGLGIALLGVIF